MGKLIAKKEILLGTKVFLPGEELPEVEKSLKEAWERSGACKEQEERAEDEPQKKIKAKRKSASAGVPVTGMENELVGRVPEKGREG